jgi:hypothetical protein
LDESKIDLQGVSQREDKAIEMTVVIRKERKRKFPKKGSEKQCEACQCVFTVKHVRWSRTCGRKCAAALRIREGTNSNQARQTWQSKMTTWMKSKQRAWKGRLNQCPQCELYCAARTERCTKCIARLSSKGLASTLQSVREWLKRSIKKCKACNNNARFHKHFCDECLKQKKRDSHDCNHRQRCRRHGVEYQAGVTIKKIVARDGMQCHYCNKPTVRWNGCWTPDITTIDHVVPLSKGGGHTIENVVIACGICNSHKRDKVNTLC